MRTKRRAKFTWFPMQGAAQAQTPSSDDDYSGIILNTLTVGSLGATATTAIGIASILFDKPHESSIATANDSMAERIGSEYVIKRMVGKIFASHVNPTSAVSPTGVLYGAGFFIARADNSVAEDLPVGGTTAALQIENYNPLTSDTIRQPWIWRRTWILGIGQTTTATPDKGLQFPATTAGYGSVMDGPHIDAKSARRVRKDERLWFIHAAKSFNNFVSDSAQISTYVDLRVLGALRRAKNRSTF